MTTKPDSYYADRFAEATDRAKELRRMTPEQAETAAEAAYQEEVKFNREYEEKQKAENERIYAMLERVKAWTPPTSEHSELKSFMISQLQMSTHGGFSHRPAVKRPGYQWLADELEKAEADLTRYADENAKAIERARWSTQWLKDLRSSLESN